jgi:uncharacterized membrane protein YjgN (DUF898 family)
MTQESEFSFIPSQSNADPAAGNGASNDSINKVAPQRFKFTGSGSEYFRIWIVNLLLTVITLTIYSAWAKVRRERFFHQHTELVGANFDYHGSPLAVLKGRIVGGVLLVLTQVPAFGWFFLSVLWGLIILGLPFMLQRTMMFKLANSSHRGLRFSFIGSVIDSYKAILFPGLIAAGLAFAPAMISNVLNEPPPWWSAIPMLALFLIYPSVQCNWRRFAVSNAKYGNLNFRTNFSSGEFYKAYFKGLGIAIIGIAAAIAIIVISAGSAIFTGGKGAGGIAATSGVIAGALLFYATMLFVQPYIGARIQNLCWNNTQLGLHRFSSDLSAKRLALLGLKNLLLTIVTIGLYRPFAVVAMAKMKLQALSFEAVGGLDDILGSATQNANAFGSEAVDLLNLDFTL